jgi:sporulation protein YlmC with PRC-barrel domain
MPTASGHTSAISAKRVLDKKIKDLTGERIGVVEDLILDKLSNNIMFAVVSFGGMLGMGEKYFPLPWSLLTYDVSDGNYIVNVSRDQLEKAPAYTVEELTEDDGEKYRVKAFEFYNEARY